MSSPAWRGLFEPDPGYLDTASIGLPPAAAVDEVAAVLDGWWGGRVRPADFDPYVERARAAWARLSRVDIDGVAIGSTVSALVGAVADSLADGSRVLVAGGDFTSVLFPMLIQQQRRNVTVTEVALEDLVPSVDDDTDLIAVCAVQSSDGRQVDVTDLLDTAEQHGARVLLDITQSCGWLPLDCSRVDYVVCAGYKWLLCPRGAAFLALRPPLLDTIAPTSAGWYAGEDIWSSIYGDAVRAHDVALADRFLTGFGLPPGGSAIATVSIEGAADRLAAAGVRASVRAGRARLSFHLHNEAADVDLALEALNRGTGPSSPGRAASTRSVTDRPPRG